MEPRVAVITDIHANLPALDAVLAHIDDAGITRVVCGGDLVGYAPWPDEVCAGVRERGIPTIYGNYDFGVGRDSDDCGCAYVTDHDRALGDQSIAWTNAHTSAEHKTWLRGLPFDLRFTLGDRRVRLVHGSPRKVNEYLFEDKPARTFERIAAGADCDVLVFGHTHKPWVATFGDVLFVNCGSVGKPKDGDPRAAYAVLEATAQGIAVTIERVAYDVDAVAAAISSSGLPSEFARKLAAAA